jgi:nascent polypeptide-associated complex subunit alpha
MFPGGLNPKKMQQMMKQLGMSQEEIDAIRVIIEKENGNRIIIENPSVTKLKIQGQETFQVIGEVTEEGVSEEDIKIIMEKTGCSKEKATEALEKTKDLTEAIMELS